MARPKGSKNKSKEVVSPAPAPTPKALEVVLERSVIDARSASVVSKLQQLNEVYGEESITDRFMDKIKDLQFSATTEELDSNAKRIEDLYFIHLLAEWSNGRIEGPKNDQTVEQRAKKADSMAEFLNKQGNHEAADKQRLKASTIRKQWKETKKLPKTPSVETGTVLCYNPNTKQWEME